MFTKSMGMKIIESIENMVESVKRPVYLTTISLLYFIYVLIFFKFINYTPRIVHLLSLFIQGFIACFLIIKFHPFRKHELKEFDSSIIFGSALLILANIGITEFIRKYFENTTTSIETVVKKEADAISSSTKNNDIKNT